MYENNGFAEGYAIGRDSGNGNSNGWGADGAWWIVILLIFGWGGFGGGFGGFGGGAGLNGALTRGELCQDMNFQSLENGVRGIQQGLCDGFYAQNTSALTGFNGLQNSMNQGFAGINTGMVTQGYENRIATNAIGTQLASCCCDIKEGIKDNTTQGVMNTNAIQQQIQNCCCDVEKMNMQSRFDAAQNNCATLQAIDKLGDRIIGYMDMNEKQNMRDELQTLRLAASQANQNAYLINALNPSPVPAYQVCNPYTGRYGYSNQGCNSGCASCC